MYRPGWLRAESETITFAPGALTGHRVARIPPAYLRAAPHKAGEPEAVGLEREQRSGWFLERARDLQMLPFQSRRGAILIVCLCQSYFRGSAGTGRKWNFQSCHFDRCRTGFGTTPCAFALGSGSDFSDRTVAQITGPFAPAGF